MPGIEIRFGDCEYDPPCPNKGTVRMVPINPNMVNCVGEKGEGKRFNFACLDHALQQVDPIWSKGGESYAQ